MSLKIVNITVACVALIMLSTSECNETRFYELICHNSLTNISIGNYVVLV